MPTFKENAARYKAWALSRESKSGKVGAIALPFLPVAMVLGLAVDSSKPEPVAEPVPVVVATPTPTPSPTPAIAPTSTAEPAKDLATQIAAEKLKKQSADEALKVAAMEEAIAQAEQERAAAQALADEQAERDRIAEEQAQAAAAMDYVEPASGGFVGGSCEELRDSGVGSDFVPGDANYTDGRDRDGDGVACES